MYVIPGIKLARKNCFLYYSIIYMILLFSLTISVSIAANTVASQNINPKDFSSRIVGDWIGICEQVVGEKKSPVQCFTLKVSQTDQNSFNSKISYYKKDESNNKFVSCGETVIDTTIAPDKSATSVIKGNGLALLGNSFKKETHQIVETFKAIGPNQLEGTGTGTMSVSGIALNMGKKGKVSKSKTTWSISDDLLKIENSMKVKFSFLCFGKTNSI
ncbi:MAG: hypothetical protein ACYC0V_12000, partial [Armatimonadota bacterium]